MKLSDSRVHAPQVSFISFGELTIAYKNETFLLRWKDFKQGNYFGDLSQM